MKSDLKHKKTQHHTKQASSASNYANIHLEEMETNITDVDREMETASCTKLHDFTLTLDNHTLAVELKRFKQ